MSFQINVDTSGLEKELRAAIAERLESSKKEILRISLGDLFSLPSWSNQQKGGPLYQIMREKAEAIALEETAKMCERELADQYRAMFNKYFDEHFPKALERSARKAAHIAAIRAAKVQTGLIK